MRKDFFYTPNHIPENERKQNIVFSILLFAYGTYGDRALMGLVMVSRIMQPAALFKPNCEFFVLPQYMREEGNLAYRWAEGWLSADVV